MNRSQWIALLLALVLTFSLCACSSQTAPTEPAPETEAPTETPATEAPTEAPTDTTEPPVEEPMENVGPTVIGTLHSLVTEETMADYDYTEQALAYLTYIGENLQNRNFGGVGADNKHDEAGHWIITELYNAGYVSAQVEEQVFEGTNLYGNVMPGRNIILTVPGLDSAYQVIVGAHYDGEGLGDNGSGVALLLANAVGMQSVTPEYTIKFIFFDGEENGMLGSNYYVENMSDKEAAQTLYYINLDTLVFGDFCNIYGGVFGDYGVDTDYVPGGTVTAVDGYSFAVETAKSLGVTVYTTEDLEGYFAEHELGMEIEDGALFTNPWTDDNPPPQNMLAPSPATIAASDHVGFARRGIEYIYFEATNWWAAGTEQYFAYTGHIETYAYQKGVSGMFMNTEYDTLEQLNDNFPDRAEQHYSLYSPLLSALLLVKAG